MTDRDLFALAAMHAFLTNSNCLNGIDDKYKQSFMNAADKGVNTKIGLEDHHEREYSWARYWASESYRMADAMTRIAR